MCLLAPRAPLAHVFPTRCTTLLPLNPKSICNQLSHILHNVEMNSNKSPCTHCVFGCFDLCTVECDCLFCSADERLESVAVVENRSLRLIGMSLQSSSNCKHDTSTARARIEQLDLFRKIEQKLRAVSKSCRLAPQKPSLRVQLVKNFPEPTHRQNMTTLARAQKVFLCLVQVLFTPFTKPKATPKPEQSITLALSSSQLSKLEPRSPRSEFAQQTKLELKRNRAQLRNAIGPSLLVHPNCNTTMRNKLREHHFGQEQKKLFSRLRSSARPFSRKPR